MRRQQGSASGAIDGRHARAERTREAIVDALLSLIEAGEVRPSAERVAERAGVSRRSLFHHFEDLEDLHRCVANRRLQTIAKLWPRLSQDGSLEERMHAFTTAISRFHDQVAPTRRAALYFAVESSVIASHVGEAYKLHRSAVEFVFEAEISKASEGERAALVAGLSATTGFAFWDELRRGQGLPEDEALVIVERLCRSLLSPERTRKT